MFGRRAGRFLAVLAAIAGSLGWSGCDAKKGDSKTIRVVRNVGSRESFRLHWEAWKAAFERDNPGWKAELVNLGNTKASEFYQARIATGDLPEVIQTWTLTNHLADNGHLVALPDDYYTKFGLPLPSAHKGARYASMGGLQLLGLAVNRKMWRDVGITAPPSSWKELLDGFAKLEAAGLKPLTYGAKDWAGAYPLMLAIHTNLYARRGAEVETDSSSWTRRRDAGQVKFATDPVARKIVRNMIDLLEKYAGEGVLSDGYGESKSEFYRGKSATWLMGCWIGGDLEPNKVDFEVEYWPFPSMTGGEPVFVTGSFLQTGWAVTTSAAGPKREKAVAVLEALYDPEVYQAWLNAEAMLATAKKVEGVSGPRSEWPASRFFCENMAAKLERYGITRGAFIALDDQPPSVLAETCKQVMQSILIGERDVTKLLGVLDREWDLGRRSE